MNIQPSLYEAQNNLTKNMGAFAEKIENDTQEIMKLKEDKERYGEVKLVGGEDER